MKRGERRRYRVVVLVTTDAPVSLVKEAARRAGDGEYAVESDYVDLQEVPPPGRGRR